MKITGSDLFGSHSVELPDEPTWRQRPLATASAIEPEEQVVINRLVQLLEQDGLAFRRLWNENFPEKELEQFANLNGLSFD